MLEIFSSLLYDVLYYGTQAVVFGFLIWFMIFRMEQFVNLVVSGGLIIAVGAGFAVVALPLLFISPLLVPVALIVVVIAPLWLVFK
ncbi:hypothetical protein [Natronomonas moolapensis]|uniref:hypothetical protein n=1 Tax=Natronomonas moolapensis TaxID=416273 RepID=UPI000677B21C|nr:hypothetical protein [Natronomonas moolapensis]